MAGAPLDLQHPGQQQPDVPSGGVPANSDNDNFTFACSTNGTSWKNRVTVTKAADDNRYRTYSLPVCTSGTVYVRVVDTNRQKNKTSLDTTCVDHMFLHGQP